MFSDHASVSVGTSAGARKAIANNPSQPPAARKQAATLPHRNEASRTGFNTPAR
jgi:hypothetical protein